MSILKYNGRLGKISGKLTSRQSANLIFQVKGQAWIHSVYTDDPYAPISQFHKNPYLYFTSSSANSAEINYGDGIVENYDFSYYNGLYFLAFSGQIGQPANGSIKNYNPIENHVFQDGNYDEIRAVSIKIKKPSNISQFHSFAHILYGTLPQEFFHLNNLTVIALLYTRELSSFPYGLTNLTAVKKILFSDISRQRLIEYPVSFSNFDLTDLSIRSCFDFSNIETSNMSLIATYENLTSLDIGLCNVIDLPSSFGSLKKLESINLNSENFSTPPANLNLITSLKNLSITCSEYGNFSSLVGLTGIHFYICDELPTDFPAWFSSLVNLKNLTYDRCFLTQEKIDGFINSFYEFIVSVAAIEMGDMPFRNMVINTSSSKGSPPNPTGAYQQPSGYVQGVTNGTPVSAFEKVWVMVNQYGHVWKIN